MITKKIANAKSKGTLLQTIFYKGRPKLLIVDKGKISNEDSWETPLGERFEPIETSYIEKGLLVVPTNLDQTKLEDVFDDLIDFFKRNVFLPYEEILLLAVFCYYTWHYDRTATSPYLMIVGDYGTAKSRALELLKLTSFNACNLGTAVSSANVYRVQEAFSGTLLIDEFENHETDKSNPFVQILNNGYKEGGIIIRSEQKNKAWVPTPFNVFGPKAIATRTLPKDDALISRCFVLKTSRVDKKFLNKCGIPLDLNAEIKKEAESLRNRLLAIRIRDTNKPAKFAGQLKFKTSVPRDEQLLRSILSVFPEKYQVMLAEILEQNLYWGRLTPSLRIEIDLACAISQILSKVDRWKNKLPLNITLKELGKTIKEFKNKTYKPRVLAAAARRMGFECQRMNTGTVIILDDINDVESLQSKYLLILPVG